MVNGRLCVLRLTLRWIMLWLLWISAAVGSERDLSKAGCGLACLVSLREELGLSEAAELLPEIKAQLDQPRVSMLDLRNAAAACDLRLTGLRIMLPELLERNQPAILHLKYDHFILFQRSEDGYVRYYDQGTLYLARIERLEQLYDGKALVYETPPVAADKPRLVCEDQITFASGLEMGRVYTCSFSVRSEGNHPLSVEALQPDSTAEIQFISDPSLLVPPGQSGEFMVNVKPRQQIGSREERAFTVFLRTNDPARPRLCLTVLATLKLPVAVMPEALDWGEVTAAGAGHKAVRVRSLTGVPFRILAVDVPEPLELLPMQSHEAPREQHRLLFRVQANASPGHFSGEISVATDAAEAHEVRVPYHVVVKAALD